MERTRWLMVFVLAVGTAFGLAGSAQAQNILTFSDLAAPGEPPVEENYQPPELQGTGITTTFTDFYIVEGDDTGLYDHTQIGDPGAESVYIYTYAGADGSIVFSRAVEVPSIWIYQDSWADSQVAGYSGGQEVWRDPAVYAEEWVEITEGAGQMIDEIVVTGGWSRIDDIEIIGDDPLHATNPTPANGEINVDPTLPLLEWDPPTEVIGPLYDVWFGTDPDLIVGAVQLEDNSPDPNTDPTPVGDLVMDTQYYWRVDVNDPNGGFPPEGVLREGTIWTFTTWPYEPIILTQPENTSTTPGGTAQFTVESGGNLAGSHYFTWYKQVGPDPNHTFDTEVKAETLESTGISTLTITNAQYNDNPVLNDEGLYYCKVRNIPGAHPDTAYSDSAGLMLMRLMARYPFNGSYTDEASQYDATKVGGGGIGSGIEGWGAFHLTGSNNYVYVPFILAEAVGAFEDFTIAAWVKPDPGEKEAVIWAGYDDTVEETAGGLSGGEGFSIERQADGTVFVRVEGNDPETISVAGAIPEDQWTYVVFVYDSNDNIGTGTVYLNGEQAEQVEYETGNAQQIGSFSMGAYRPDGGSPRWFLDGWLDDVRFYAYPITAVNAASLYNEITGGSACVRPESPEPADLNGDCHVDMLDIKKWAETWLVSNIVP